MKKGFTLIELLVVVLIIGILSAIALPQYNKAVFKSRMAEAFTNLKTLKNALDVCELENGRVDFSSGNDTCFQESNLDISIDSSKFFYGVDRGNFSDDASYAVCANVEDGYDVAICLHDDGHFSTPSGSAECHAGNYPNFNVAKTLGIEEDDGCGCC